jgi:hypothetical protein
MVALLSCWLQPRRGSLNLLLEFTEEGKRLMGSMPIKEVEAALATFPGLANVTVVEQGAGPDDQWLVAYVSSSGPGLDVSALHAHARKVLSGDMWPASIVVLEEIPLTADGAIDRKALPVPDLDAAMPFRAPSTARQETLCAIFAEALGVAKVGVDDDFFRLGGQSVQAVLLAARVSSAMGVRMLMADLFKAPTVGELDRWMDIAAK